MADSVLNIGSKSLKVVDNGDSTFSLSAASIDMGAIQGLATGGTVTTLQDSSKNLLVNSLQGKSVKIIIDGVEYIREIISNTADTLTFANIVAKVAATAVIEKTGEGKVTITAVPEGTYANDFEVVTVQAEGASADTEAAFTDGVLTITLGTDAGTAASADIGTGEHGVVTTTFKEVGVKTGYAIEVSTQATVSAPLSVGWNSTAKKINLTLGTDGAGVPDATKNTATLIAAAINSNPQLTPLFTAVASGDGSGVFSAAIEAVAFAGGVDPVVDATAADVVTEVDALTGFSAVVDSAGLLEALVDPVAFSGGVDEVKPTAGDGYFIFGGESVQLSGSKAQDSETITVDNTVGGKALTTAKIAGCTKAFITVEDAQLRWTVDGTAPTTTVGHIANPYDIIDLVSAEDMAAFRAIRTGSTSAKLYCTYSA